MPETAPTDPRLSWASPEFSCWQRVEITPQGANLREHENGLENTAIVGIKGVFGAKAPLDPEGLLGLCIALFEARMALLNQPADDADLTDPFFRDHHLTLGMLKSHSTHPKS